MSFAEEFSSLQLGIISPDRKLSTTSDEEHLRMLDEISQCGTIYKYEATSADGTIYNIVKTYDNMLYMYNENIIIKHYCQPQNPKPKNRRKPKTKK